MPDKVWLPTMIKRGLLIILMASFISILFNFINPSGITLINNYSLIKIDQQKVKVPVFLSRQAEKSRELNIHPPEDITLQKVHSAFFKGQAVFIDARSREKYRKGHIPGAISVPVNNIQPENIDLQHLDPGQKIIVYCDDPDCLLSMELAAILEHKGFMNVYFFTGGWEEWKEAGYQMSRGNKP